MLASIAEGTDVVFMTCDPLFMEQFFKLGHFLATHYLAAEFGRKYVAKPDDFPTYQPKESIETIFLRHDLPEGWERTVLPTRTYGLNLHCWLLGAKSEDNVRFASQTFCAERPMHRLLQTKGTTGGLNVEGLDGRNVRIGGRGPQAVVANITQEKRIPIGSADCPSDDRLDLRVESFPEFDLIRAVNNNEGEKMIWHES